MALFPSSVIVTTAAIASRVRDQLSFPFNARPQAMTVYIRFRELGNLLNANSGRVLHIGAAAGTDPRFLIDGGTGGFYRVVYDNGPTAVSSTLATAPIYGDRVELRATLSATGIVQIHQSINEGAEVSATASGSATMAAAWSAATLWINSVSTSNVGFLALRNLRIERGSISLQQMRALEQVA